MEYKWLAISRAIEIQVPLGLSPEQEAEYIDRYKAKHDPEGELRRYIAQLDPVKIEAECREALEQWEKGELLPIDDILAELEKELPSADEGAA